MQFVEWSVEADCYNLSSEYCIRKADPEEWGIYCSVYYDMRYIGFFREQGFNNSRNNSFWIYREGFKIGGVRISPNTMYHLFFIPPFQETFEVLKLLKLTLIRWSDRTKPIKAYEVLPVQVSIFTRAGFWPDEFRCRWMQRPTDHFDVVWGDNLIIKSPQILDNGRGEMRYINEDEIAQSDFQSFVGGFEAVRRKKSSLEDFIPDEDPNITNDILLQA